MLKPRNFFALLLTIHVGCTTDSQKTLPPAWDAEPESARAPVQQVDEAPRIAPPTSTESPPKTATVSPVALNNRWISLNEWSQQDNRANVSLVWNQPLRYSVQTSNGAFLLQINSQSARWEGAELRLGFPARLIGGEPCLNSLDFSKNLEPLMHHPQLTNSPPVVVIDPGHGGPSPGTRSVLDGAAEKTFALDWALRLESLLSSNGWQVFLTRTNDSDLSLAARVAFAEDRKADLFISLHFNSAAPSQEQAGLETICLTPSGMPSTFNREYPDDPTLVFPNNAFDAANLRYAMILHRSLLKVNGVTDRGIRRARFPGVLRGQNRPAVLIEGGFLSNPAEATRIADPAFRQQLAEAVASALIPLRSSEDRPVDPVAFPAITTNGPSQP